MFVFVFGEIACSGHQLRWLRDPSCHALLQPAHRPARTPRGRRLHPVPLLGHRLRLKRFEPLQSPRVKVARLAIGPGARTGEDGGWNLYDQLSALCSACSELLMFG